MHSFAKVDVKNLYKILLFPCLLVAISVGWSDNVDNSSSKNSKVAKHDENQLKELFNKQIEKGSTKTDTTDKEGEEKNTNGSLMDIFKKRQNTKTETTDTSKNNVKKEQLPGQNNQLPRIDQTEGFAKIIGAVSPAVVSIVTIQEIEDNFPSIFEDFFGDNSPFDFFGFDDFFNNKQKRKPRRTQKSIGAASGFCVKVVGDKLYIATNYHVVENAKTVAIFFHDQSVSNIMHDKDKLITATVHGVDPKSDLAVLEVDMNNKNLKGRQIQTITWGSSDDLQIGNYVIAIGNPFGIGISVSQGIVSAKGRQLLGEIKTNSMENYIQHTAALNRGNSGGVLINMNSEVVGVNNAIYTPNGGNVGVGFAIPSNSAKTIIDSLIQYKRTFRGWLGATIQGIKTQEALNMGLLPQSIQNTENLPPYFGVLVNEVSNDGPAAQAGIKPGDIIVLFDGQLIDEANKLPKLVNNHKIKEPATLTVVRRDQATGALNQIEVKVDIGDYQDFEKLDKKSNKNADKNNNNDEKSLVKIPGLDIFVGEENTTQTDNKKEETKKQVVVKKVKKQRDDNEVFGSLFEFSNPFEIGDIIEVANSTQITSANQLKDIISVFQKEHPGESMTFKIARRNGKNTSPVIITMTINKDDANSKNDDDKYEDDNPRLKFNEQLDDDDGDDSSNKNGIRRFRFFSK